MKHSLHGLSETQWLALSLMPGLGTTRLAHLWTYLDTLHQPQSVEASLFPELDESSHSESAIDFQTLRALGWPEHTARAVMLYLNRDKLPYEAESSLQTALDWLQSDDQQLVFRGTGNYPALLGRISVPPTFLYVKGQPSAWDKPTLGMVGARAASGYGRKIAEQWGMQMSQQGFSIISGGARGIDTYAHQGALNAQQATVAVMGTGLFHPYPKQNIGLFQQILEYGGALVSEYPLTTGVRPNFFPPRNRIISGMSHGVFVVEASEKSGSLISARYALEENREVFALPGRVSDPQASGTNQLIRQGATLVTSIDDILAELPRSVRSPVGDVKQDVSALPEGKVDVSGFSISAQTLVEVFQQERIGLDFDALVRRTGLPAPELSQTLMELELSGVITNAQGQYQFSA
ncbi:DNA-processing protein DprA [Marinomonas ostreistagni]|uniref:DNA-processing protein DprA n=1 Tax=Marinomonas ostreistagni TaxID=359209 RepID=UPI00194EF1FA|nr:DNA-processing protein DprA [Marinomonas ostreistagni]MBM6550673.1 DNA-processing protein DprA [Marinomonas ostreistagni]